MLKLTDTQLVQLYNLKESPLIDFSSIAHHSSGYTHIHVSSTFDANWRLVALELSYIFPDIEIDRKQIDGGPVTYDVEAGDGIVIFLSINETPAEGMRDSRETS